MTPQEAVHTFMNALEHSDGERAASVCADDVVIVRGGGRRVEGRDGARRWVRQAPTFIRRVREEELDGNRVVLRGLTRAPGAFANFTTWAFDTDGERITHLRISNKPAN